MTLVPQIWEVKVTHCLVPPKDVTQAVLAPEFACATSSSGFYALLNVYALALSLSRSLSFDNEKVLHIALTVPDEAVLRRFVGQVANESLTIETEVPVTTE